MSREVTAGSPGTPGKFSSSVVTALTAIGAVVIAGLAIIAFSFFAVVGIALLMLVFVAGAVASLFSSRRAKRMRGPKQAYGPVTVTVVGRGSSRPSRQPAEVIEAEIVDEHTVDSRRLSDGTD